MITLARTTRLLFIGDSITDCDRRNDPGQLGHGYVRLVRDHLATASPKDAPLVMNCGISGNKITDLQKRWQRDVLAERPDVLSIFIGINDVWHGLFPGREGTTIDAFRATYRDLLTTTRDALPNCAIILCEPSVIDPPVHDHGNERLQPYVAAVHEMAKEFATQVRAVVSLHSAFRAASDARPDIAWTTDGVHPTSAGHMLIARTWLTSTGLI